MTVDFLAYLSLSPSKQPSLAINRSRLSAPSHLRPLSDIPHVIMRQSTLPILLGAILAAMSFQQAIADDVENCWCGTAVSMVGSDDWELRVDLNDPDKVTCTKPLSTAEHDSRVGSEAYCRAEQTNGQWQHLCCDKCREWSSRVVVQTRRWSACKLTLRCLHQTRLAARRCRDGLCRNPELRATSWRLSRIAILSLRVSSPPVSLCLVCCA